MPYLLHIGFDSSCRLRERTMYFEYRGVPFKLVRGTQGRFCDVLMSLVDQPDSREHSAAFAAAGEFLSAFAWEHRAKVMFWEIGGRGAPPNVGLRKVPLTMRSFRCISVAGYCRTAELRRLPLIETEAQRTALALFRDASAIENDYLALIFFWQVLETGGTNPVNWLNSLWRKKRLPFKTDDFEVRQLELTRRPLGDYLENDCRHAVAHIRRKSGSTQIVIDDRRDRMRMKTSRRIAEAVARQYIVEHLRLTQQVLLQPGTRGSIPVYSGM